MFALTDFPAVITRSSNNYGPYQFPEKFLPLMITNALDDKPLPDYGDGKQQRDWLHVEDNCRGFLAVLERGRMGEVYNIGGSGREENLTLAVKLLRLDGKAGIAAVLREGSPGPRPALRLELRQDGGGARVEAGDSLEEGLRQTIEWYKANDAWLAGVRGGEYRSYYKNITRIAILRSAPSRHPLPALLTELRAVGSDRLRFAGPAKSCHPDKLSCKGSKQLFRGLGTPPERLSRRTRVFHGNVPPGKVRFDSALPRCSFRTITRAPSGGLCAACTINCGIRKPNFVAWSRARPWMSPWICAWVHRISANGPACCSPPKQQNQLYIPAGFAHGFLALTETVQFLYKCSDFYRSRGRPRHPVERSWNRDRLGNRRATALRKGSDASNPWRPFLKNACPDTHRNEAQDSADWQRWPSRARAKPAAAFLRRRGRA